MECDTKNYNEQNLHKERIRNYDSDPSGCVRVLLAGRMVHVLVVEAPDVNRDVICGLAAAGRLIPYSTLYHTQYSSEYSRRCS